MALYFQRMAPSITSAYSILGDTDTSQGCGDGLRALAPRCPQSPSTSRRNTIAGLVNIADLQKPAYLRS